MCVLVYLQVGLMKVKEMSWFQKGSFSDMDSVPTRVLRLGLSDRSLTWLVLAPIAAASPHLDAPIFTALLPGIRRILRQKKYMFFISDTFYSEHCVIKEKNV